MTQDRSSRKLNRYIGTASYYRIGNGETESFRTRRVRAAFWYLLFAAVFFSVGLSFALF